MRKGGAGKHSKFRKDLCFLVWLPASLPVLVTLFPACQRLGPLGLLTLTCAGNPSPTASQSCLPHFCPLSERLEAGTLKRKKMGQRLEAVTGEQLPSGDIFRNRRKWEGSSKALPQNAVTLEPQLE